MSDELTVNEIFRSIQGEGTRAGLPCVLVRLTGCNLNCTWCDTEYARDQGRTMSIDQIVARVGELNCPRVEVTGGEPLVQAATRKLLRRLCDEGYEVLLETNGSQSLAPVDPRVVKIVDVKCPSSGMSAQNRWENLEYLSTRDEVKFVIARREDFDFARRTICDQPLLKRHKITFSPVHESCPPSELAKWMLDDSDLPRDVRLGLQLHKVIWPGVDRGV
ncbi:MAG: radical SAM protein [Phycisphaerae bacterium]